MNIGQDKRRKYCSKEKKNGVKYAWEMKSGSDHVLYQIQKRYTEEEKAPQLIAHMLAHVLIYTQGMAILCS